MTPNLKQINLLVALQCASLSFADSGASFLKIDPSPRSYALGGHNANASAGAEGMNLNPARLSLMDRKYEVFSAFSLLTDGAQYGHAAFSFHRTMNGHRRIIDAFGLAATYLNAGSLEGRDTTGAKTGSFGSQDRAIALSAASKISKSVRVGLSGKVVQSEIAGYKSNMALATDMGISYSPLSKMSLAMTANNLGQKLRFIEQQDNLPASIDLGLSLGWGQITGYLGAMRMLYEDKADVKLGVEYWLGPVALRAGYRATSKEASGIAGGLSTGVGIQVGPMRLDYAVGRQAQDMGLTHRAGLSMQWGKRTRKWEN